MFFNCSKNMDEKLNALSQQEYDSLEREYAMLHDEIMKNKDDVLKITTICLPVIVTALGFAIEKNIWCIAPAVFFFAYTMINKQVRIRKATIRNAAYCEQFLERKLVRNWETYLRRLQQKKKDDLKNEDCHKRIWSRFTDAMQWLMEWVVVEVFSICAFIMIKFDGKSLKDLSCLSDNILLSIGTGLTKDEINKL